MSRCEDERGFTVTELLVTLTVMGIMVTAAFSVMYRVFADTGIIENRRNLMGDGRIALQQMTKQIRQATALHNYVTPGDATTIDMDTYIGATQVTDPTTRVIWRTQGAEAPYELQVSTDGGATYRTVLSSLVSPNIFTYTEHGGVLDQVDVSLALGLKTTDVTITSSIELRNTNEGSG
jgi:prepilin-type N-terminal cleavage/methylation domain-containing protein